jgi:hypothetical protein
LSFFLDFPNILLYTLSREFISTDPASLNEGTEIHDIISYYMNKQLFITQDFWLSAYLLASGVSLVSHSRKAERSTFYFEETPRSQALMDSFFKLTARVEPSNYGRSIAQLKRIMYDGANLTTTTGYLNNVKQSKGSARV